MFKTYIFQGFRFDYTQGVAIVKARRLKDARKFLMCEFDRVREIEHKKKIHETECDILRNQLNSILEFRLFQGKSDFDFSNPTMYQQKLNHIKRSLNEVFEYKKITLTIENISSVVDIFNQLYEKEKCGPSDNIKPSYFGTCHNISREEFQKELYSLEPIVIYQNQKFAMFHGGGG